MAGQVAVFEEDPSVNVFMSLVGAAPALRDRLLDSARSRFLPPQNAWTSTAPAFSIFEAANADEDALALLDQTVSGADKCGSAKEETVLEAISYLMTRSPEIRARARPHFERGLIARQRAVIKEMEHAFPTLEKEWCYLTKQVDQGKITKLAPEEPPTKRPKVELYSSVTNGVHPRAHDSVRGSILKKFCDAAGWQAAHVYESDEDEDEDERYSRYGCYGDSDEDEDMMVDEEDYLSRAEKEDAPLDVITSLQRWVKVLEQWPDAAERVSIKEAMRKVLNGGVAFYEVDGAADSLARR